MLEGETAAIIAGTSAIGGSLIVAVSNYAISSAQARSVERDALSRVLVELGHALSRVEQRLRLEPKPGKTTRAINETMDTKLPQLHYTIGQIRRRLLEPELTELSTALSKALSAATVTATPEMLPVLGVLAELMGEAERAERRERDWWKRWNEARADYFVQSRRVLSSPGLRARLARTSRH